jgi:hypothetical protein
MLRLRSAGVLLIRDVEVYGSPSARRIPLIASALPHERAG